VGGATVIATGAEWPGGLALLRGLRAGGYPPIAALVADDALARRSRAPVAKVRVPDAAIDPEAHARALAALARERGAAAVLPGVEASMRAVSEHRDAFGTAVVLGVPEAVAVRRALDKLELEALAERAGLRTPPTRIVAGPEEYAGPFPAIVKPPTSLVVDAAGDRHQLRVARADDAGALRAVLAGMPGGAAVVQPYLPARLRTVNGVAWRGDLVCAVHKRSDRTYPPDAGVFAYGRTVEPDPALEQGCAQLLAELGWSGLFNLQFLEPSPGEHLLIDLNPRAYHSLSLAIGAGANLPAVWCDLLLGRPPRPVRTRPGVRFRAEEEDLRTLRALARTGAHAEVARALLPRRRTVHALFQARDPAPVLHLRTLVR
jgi:predicted ATP-grasp superfamily ATP-dependent carboligase